MGAIVSVFILSSTIGPAKGQASWPIVPGRGIGPLLCDEPFELRLGALECGGDVVADDTAHGRALHPPGG